MLQKLLKLIFFLPIIAHADPYPIQCYTNDPNVFVSITVSMMQGAIPKFSKKLDLAGLAMMEHLLQFDAITENVKISAIKLACDYKPSQIGFKLQRNTSETFLETSAPILAGQTPRLWLHYYKVDATSVVIIGHK